MQTITNLPTIIPPILSKEKLVIGDVHGKVEAYREILKKNPNLTSIQVGDFGFKKEHDWFLNEIDCDKHKVNFGNHDYIPYVNYKHSLRDYSFNAESRIFTFRGAWSVDSRVRKIGVDWWSDEQVSYRVANEAAHFFQKYEPRVMITHDCPDDIRKSWFNIQEKSLTSNALQVMFELYQPDVWIFGHHHKSKSGMFNGTKFICLNELETIII